MSKSDIHRGFLDTLDLAGLLDLRDAIDALIAERQAQEDLGSTDPPQADNMLPKYGGGDFTNRPRGSWVELKIINGCGPYAYLRWREKGRCRSRYIGKVQERDV